MLPFQGVACFNFISPTVAKSTSWPMTLLDASLRQEKFSIPWDLSEWVDRPSLLRFISADLETLDWASPELQVFLATNPAYRPKVMLQLLTYAYATGLFESEEIARGCEQNEILRSLAENQPPSTNSIVRFRRENRGLLKWLLAQVFKRVVQNRFDLGNTPVPMGLRRYLEDAAGARVDTARHLDQAPL
jgi:transposase